MTTHMIWALIGFGIAVLFFIVYQLLKWRGVRFFWYHPIFAGVFLLFVLYLLENVFAELSSSEMQLNWNMMFILGVPLLVIFLIFLFRGFTMLRKK